MAAAIARFNALILAQMSVSDIQKASLVSQTLLVTAITRFISGSIDQTQFEAATSSRAAAAAISAATLPGTLYGDPTPGQSQEAGSDLNSGVNGRLVGGLVGGLGGGAIVLGLGLYLAHRYLSLRKQRAGQAPAGALARASAAPGAKAAPAAAPVSVDLEAVAAPASAPPAPAQD